MEYQSSEEMHGNELVRITCIHDTVAKTRVKEKSGESQSIIQKISTLNYLYIFF